MNQQPHIASPSSTTESGIARDLDAQTPFFAVSLPKLLVLSVCTLTLYEVYWFYQNWKRIAAREPGKYLSAPRALFAVLFCYQCFAKIRDFDARLSASSTLAAVPLAIGWILATVMWKLPDPYWWVAMSAVIFMLPVQAHANAINAAMVPNHASNAKFTPWNWVAIVLGDITVVLAVLGTLLPHR